MLVLNFAHPDKTAVQLFTLVIVYRPPGPYTTFLSEFADFSANLVVNTDKILIVAFTDLLPGSYCQVNEDSIVIPTNPNLAEMNQLADSIQFTLRKMLDAVVPLKRKKIPQKMLAPWYNDHTRALKQALRKLERKWRSTNLQFFFLAWKDSLTSYKHALSAARSSYFYALLEEHKNNPRYLFHTVASLTKSHASADPLLDCRQSNKEPCIR